MNIDMQSLIGEMSILIDKIKSGSATQGEIEAFTSAAAELHERAVVLRYKSYEAGIFARNAAPAEHLEQTNDTPVAEELVTTEAAVESHDNDTDIGFSLFEETTETAKKGSEPEGFDLFSMDDDEEELTFDQPDFEEEERPAVEEPAADISEEPEDAFEAPQPESEETLHDPEPVIEQPSVAGEVESAPEAAEERPVLASPDATFSAPYDELLPKVQPEEATEAIHPLYNRLKNNDDSLAAKLMAVRLDTLKGAFGFNERMQIVQELFQGNNDAFSEAIDALDQLESKNEARQKVTGYANRFSWDERSDLVMEFVQKVERRYA